MVDSLVLKPHLLSLKGVTSIELEEAREVFIAWADQQDEDKKIYLGSLCISIQEMKNSVLNEDKFGKELIFALISEVRKTNSSINQVIAHL